jgi:hypothetical protein
MASATYRIVDEPLPGPRNRLVVNPTWPLFAMMLGGAWLAWPWFVFNAWAMSSPRLGRTAAWVAGGVAGAAGMSAAVGALIDRGALSEAAIPYTLIVLVVWKLLISYALTLDQERSFELYRYFGGKVANGVWVVLVGSFYLTRQLDKAIDGIDPGRLRAILTWVLA